MEARPEYDVVIGNPPWRSSDAASAGWCERHGLPAPNKQAAWGFFWKALRHLKKDGGIAFLLPAMSFLHNHSGKALEARSRLFRSARIHRIVNYADLRFQLFSIAVRPAALFIAGLNPDAVPHEFDYWAPKASPSSGATRLVSINEADKKRLNTVMVERDPLEFKKRMWMIGPESKLLRYLSTYPRLRAKVAQHGRSNGGQDRDSEPTWMIGQGFQPVPEDRLEDASYRRTSSEAVATMQFLPTKSLRIFAPDLKALVLRHDEAVRRRGFEKGFEGPRVLISQGIGNRRLKAAYSEKPFTFQHAIQAISVPDADRESAKLLAALLNSKLLFWFVFHSTLSVGSERPKVHQDQLLDLPFPAPEDTPEAWRSHNAARGLIALIDGAPGKLDDQMQPPNLLDRMLDEVDRLACDYFALTEQQMLIAGRNPDAAPHELDYWVPKASPSSGAKKRMWMTDPESKLFRYLSTYPRLRAKVAQHRRSNVLQGFEKGFDGPRVLISQGIGNRRLKAAYSETPFTFQHAIQAIAIPGADRESAKLIAALLNSKLLFWFAFHSTSSIGSERPKVHQDQLLDLPFPAPEETPEPQRSHNAAKGLIALIDGASGKLDGPMQPPNLLDRMLDEVDRLACDYFALTEREMLVVEETCEYIVPALQPRASAFPRIWEPPTDEQRRGYAQVLISSLDDWTEGDSRVSVALVARNHDLAVLRLRLCSTQDWAEYTEESNEIGALLTDVARESNTELPGNIHQVSNLRMYAGDDMYMVKPNSLRFWMRSAAQDDAEQVVVDIEESRRGIG